MKKLICTVFCAAVAAVQMSHAGVESKSFKEKVVVETENCNFRDMEFQLDLFGAFAANPEFDTRGRTLNTGVGGGVGVNFFFARYFGIGVEGLWYDNGGSAEHMFIGNLFFRYPICKWNIAPYVMLGGGAGFDHELVGFGHVGGGMEWRFHKNIGLFADGRYFFGAPDALGMTRLGLRLAF
jgi:hypothetical protein